MGGSCLLHNPVVLELHIAKSLNHSPFLGGLSCTLWNLISFPFAGKTLCLTRGPPHLIAEPGARHHSSASARVPTKPRCNLRILLNTGTQPPKTPEVYVLSLVNHVTLLQITGCGSLVHKTHGMFWFSLQISAITYSWMTEGNPPPVAGNFSWSTCYLQKPTKCRFLSYTPTPDFKFLEISLGKVLAHSHAPPNLWASTFTRRILHWNPRK